MSGKPTPPAMSIVHDDPSGLATSTIPPADGPIAEGYIAQAAALLREAAQNDRAKLAVMRARSLALIDQVDDVLGKLGLVGIDVPPEVERILAFRPVVRMMARATMADDAPGRHPLERIADRVEQAGWDAPEGER